MKWLDRNGQHVHPAATELARFSSELSAASEDAALWMEGIQELLGIYTGTQSERASLLSHIHLLGTALDDAGFVSHSAGTDVAAALRSALSLADEFTRARDSALRTSAE